MVRRNFAPGGHLFGTNLLRQRAAGAETAAGRRVHRAGHIALQDDPLAFLFDNTGPAPAQPRASAWV